MVVLAPSALATAVLTLGMLLLTLNAFEDEEKSAEAAKDGRSAEVKQIDDYMTGIFGLAIAGAGAWLLWIGPNPEPLGAWIAYWYRNSRQHDDAGRVRHAQVADRRSHSARNRDGRSADVHRARARAGF